MTYDISDPEVSGVNDAAPEKQYDYFVGKASDWGEVWLVHNADRGGYGLIEGDGGEDDVALAVWAHPAFVAACQAELFKAYEAVAMPVEQFTDDLLARVASAGDEVAVMPLADGRSVRVPPERLQSDLRDALGAIGDA